MDYQTQVFATVAATAVIFIGLALIAAGVAIAYDSILEMRDKKKVLTPNAKQTII